jgi:hypothetical protein
MSEGFLSNRDPSPSNESIELPVFCRLGTVPSPGNIINDPNEGTSGMVIVSPTAADCTDDELVSLKYGREKWLQKEGAG